MRQVQHAQLLPSKSEAPERTSYGELAAIFGSAHC